MGSINGDHGAIIIALAFWLIYLSSSIWVYFDARRLKRLTNSEKIKPWVWLISCLAIWIIAFPIYMFSRRGK